MITPEQFKILLPLACAWAEEQEGVVLRDGVPLSPAQIADAETIGVAHSEKVRLLKVTRIPIPEHPALRAAADATQLLSPHTGLTLRYGIFIRADCWDDRRLIFHELVHTLQYERLGGFQQFLQLYLDECITIGYPAGPMEQEAVTMTENSTNLRVSYAADQVIFNWERGRQQLRIDGGPANGKHKFGAGTIPTNRYVVVRWVVTPNKQSIYVDDQIRFEHSGDYSNIDNPISIFGGAGSQITLKSIKVRQLPPGTE